MPVAPLGEDMSRAASKCSRLSDIQKEAGLLGEADR